MISRMIRAIYDLSSLLSMFSAPDVKHAIQLLQGIEGEAIRSSRIDVAKKVAPWISRLEKIYDELDTVYGEIDEYCADVYAEESRKMSERLSSERRAENE